MVLANIYGFLLISSSFLLARGHSFDISVERRNIEPSSKEESIKIFRKNSIKTRLFPNFILIIINSEYIQRKILEHKKNQELKEDKILENKK